MTFGKRRAILLALSCAVCCCAADETTVLFEGFEPGDVSAFREKSGKVRKADYRGKQGSSSLSDKNPASGTYSFEFQNMEKSGALLGAAKFKLKGGETYCFSFQQKADPGCGVWINMGYSIQSNSKTLKESIAFMFDRKKQQENAGKWMTFHEKNGYHTFYVPGLEGKKRHYIAGRGGVFEFPEKLFGNGEIECDLLIFCSGVGVVNLDNISMIRLPKKKSADGISSADDAERVRLLASGKVQTGNWTPEVWKWNRYQWIFHPYQAPERPGVKPEKAPFELKIRRGNFIKNGVPSFLLMSDDRYLCGYLGALFGNDLENGNAILDFLAEKKEKTVHIRLTDHNGGGFLRTYWNERMREGLLVWYQIGDTYMMWQPKVLSRDFRELFTSNEGFFGFRPEHPMAHKLRLYRWDALLNLAKGYPIAGCEAWNELNYMDYSEHNIRIFREKMKRKYGGIAAANRVWNTSFREFSEVIPPPDAISLGGKTSVQFRVDWHAAVEQIFGDSMRNYISWLHQRIPGVPCSIQSYCGLPYDYQQNHVNPVLKYAAEDIYGSEHGTTFFPQWAGGETEDEIIYTFRAFPILRYLDTVSRDKPILDPECPITSGKKTVAKETTVVDLNGAWKFMPAVSDPKGTVRQENQQKKEFAWIEEDPGVKKGWYKSSFDDSAWKEISIPGLWSARGYPECRIGWYRRTFSVPEGSGPLYLVGGELADQGVLYLNGKEIYRNSSFSASFALDVSKLLRRGAKNTLAVKIHNAYGRNGFYWGGIRAPMAVASVTPERIPLSPEQMSTAIWMRALYGHGGMAICYPYMSEVQKGGLLNPESSQPEAIAAIPQIKQRLDSLGGLFLERPILRGKIAVLYSLNSFRAHVPGGRTALPTEKTNDYTRSYLSLLLTNHEPEPIGDDALRTLNPSEFPALFLFQSERLDRDAVASLQRYVEKGGVVVLDGTSATRDNFDGSILDARLLTGVSVRSVRGNSGDVVFSSPEGLTLKSAVGLASQHSGVELKLAGATPIGTDSDGRIVASVRKIGKGQVYVIGASLTVDSGRRLYQAILRRSGQQPDLEVLPAKDGTRRQYVETHVLERGDRSLWAMVNWGAENRVHLRGRRKFSAGEYFVSDAANGIRIPSPAGRMKWTDRELNAPVPVVLKNQNFVLWVIEPARGNPIELPVLPAAQKRALDRYFLAQFRETPAENGRVLWFGGSNFSPTRLPSAVNMIRAMNLGVDASIRYEPLKSEINVLRGRRMIREKLASYKLIVIPAYFGDFSKAESELLRQYVGNGGSLLLMSTHRYHMHSSSGSHNLNGVAGRCFGAEYPWAGAVEDPVNCRLGEPRYLTTRKIEKHPITEGVREFCSGGSVGIRLKPDSGAKRLISPEATARIAGSFDALFAVSEYGKGRIVLSGDTEWLQMRNLPLGDNARLWSNIIAWMTGTKTPDHSTLKKIATPEKWK